MPGSNAGTGQRLYARCSKCARYRGARARVHYGFSLTLTGRRKPIRPTHNKAGGRMDMDFAYEYRCDDFGHVGFSRHMDLSRRWQREFGKCR